MRDRAFLLVSLLELRSSAPVLHPWPADILVCACATDLKDAWEKEKEATI